ncbi:MAG TPA: flagellar hook-length control protein FliK, partial [Candidatus Elarobacter sp.]|nr:flagellar hook-length control protein FliK [Candidatus Elarobacter sp.]
TPHGTSNAHISVKREAPDARGGARLDAENFRIAFVLETAHYGTVAIDLVTVGREVTVDVRTEAAPAMRAFRDALGSLTARLESMRYRVASAGASVGTTSTVAVEAPPSAPVDPDATVDRSA